MGSHSNVRLASSEATNSGLRSNLPRCKDEADAASDDHASIAALDSEATRLDDPAVPQKWNDFRHAHIWLIALGYAALRLFLIPTGADLTNAFSHDSAYIAIVARNVLAGRGLVNDASWLVFLNPRALPMPFHNANPLYVLMTAGAALFAHKDIPQAGIAISALANAGLVLALVALLGRFVESKRLAVTLAFAVALFPPVFAESLQMLPDALCLALSVAFVAALVREEWRWSAPTAGVFLGLAWLTRSSAVVLVPSACVYVMLTSRPRRAVLRLAIVGFTASLVVMPWLAYTAVVWGNPFRSDAGYYLVQDLASKDLGYSVLRYWHSPQPPPHLVSIIENSPGAFLRWISRGELRVIVELGRAWSSSSWIIASELAVILGIASFSSTRALRQPIWVAGVVYTVIMSGIVAIRPMTIEVRYLLLVSVLAGLVMALTTLQLIRQVNRRRHHIEIAIAAVALAYWLVTVPSVDVHKLLHAYETSSERVEERLRAVQARALTNGPLVVAEPYFQVWDAGGQALSIPYSDDEFLVGYMRRFRARYVLLTDAEVNFWRPGWKQLGGRPAGLHSVARVAHANLFELGTTP